MNSLKIFTVACMLFSGVAMAKMATSAGDPSTNNTTNMDNTGVNAPVSNEINSTDTNTQLNNQLNDRGTQPRMKPMKQTSANRNVTNDFAAADRVRSVQEALSAEGHDVGTADGILGARTSAAIEEYQRNNNLQVTGKINQATLDRLGLDYGAEQKNDTDTFAE